LSVPRITQAQGTTYLSNLGETSTGSSAVGSNSWLAASFFAPIDSGGYFLNSIQLAMNDASGTPNGFTVKLRTIAAGSSFPGSSVASLSGSPNPSTAGIYTYTAPANLILQGGYFIEITAGTPVASGAYEWSSSNINSYNPTGGWGIPSSTPFLLRGSDGRWNPISGTHPQFAINASPVPEPGVSALLALGGLCFLSLRRKAKAV
jgi:hypothetical protein